MMKFSLILPVYNVEKYLPKCLDSCLQQDLSLKEYEIIVVIDGSPDHSLQIAKKYQAQYPNIKIVEQANGGLSAARNTGLRHAVGEYVWFIDSDDCITANVLKNIYATLTAERLECLWIRWDNVNEAYQIFPLYDLNINRISEIVYTGYDFMKSVLGIYLYAWSFIYRRDFLQNNSLFFKDGMYYEDTEFAFRALPLLKRIRLYNNVCYKYVNRSNSIVNSINEKKLEDICTNMTTAHRFYIQANDYALKQFYFKCYSSFLLLVMKETAKSGEKQLKDSIHRVVKRENMIKVFPTGGMGMKMIGHIYNALGFNVAIALLSLLLHHKRMKR